MDYMRLSRNPRSCGPPHLSGLDLLVLQVLLSTTRVMGNIYSTSALSRKRLGELPNSVYPNVPAVVSSRPTFNPATTTGREMDRLLESHTRVVRSAMKPKLFRKDSRAFESSLKKYSIAVERLDATLSNVFETLLKASHRMHLDHWDSK
jgi:hypothetical protein